MKSGIRIIRHMMPTRLESLPKRDNQKWKMSEWKKPTNTDAKILGFDHFEKTFSNPDRAKYDWWGSGVSKGKSLAKNFEAIKKHYFSD